MGLFDIFKKKDVVKGDTGTSCNHGDALPNSKFCPRCGAKIERTFQKSLAKKGTINVDINNCYICVLHFRCISAMITPMSHPVQEYVFVYNGKYKNDYLKCNDDESEIRVKIDSKEITLEFYTHTEKMSYSINEVCQYHVPIYDAMESWAFIISDAPIQNELFMPDYQQSDDGIYYNIKDMQENKNRLISILERFK